MVEDTQSGTVAPPTQKRATSALTDDRKYAFGVITLSVCLTLGVISWAFGWVTYDPPRDTTSRSSTANEEQPPPEEEEKLRLPSDWENEDVILHVDIPDGWESQNTPYRLFLGSLNVDAEGEAKISPANTAQSDPTGLTVNHFFPVEYPGVFPRPGSVKVDGMGDYMVSPQSLETEGRRLPPTGSTERAITPVGGREALALTYDLSSPAGSHKCTERQLIVNQIGAIIRLCSPAGADRIPKEYQALLSSVKWHPRTESNFAQSAVITNPAPDTLNISLPDGWRRLTDPLDNGIIEIGPAKIAGRGLLYIRRIPPSSMSGKLAIYPTDTPPEPCSPEWKTMVDTWEPSGKQRWLEERTIGGEKACGFINDPSPYESTEHHWFVPREDGLWIFNVGVFPPRQKPAPRPGAQSGAEQEPQLDREHYRQAYRLLDQVTWTDAKEKGAE